MGLIKDIRLHESAVPNADGYSAPCYCGKIIRYDHMACLALIQRLLFLLEYLGFGFADFDHLITIGKHFARIANRKTGTRISTD